MTRTAMALGLVTAMLAGPLSAETSVQTSDATVGVNRAAIDSAERETATTGDKVLTIAGIRIGNPIDPSTWWDAHDSAHDTAPVQVNFADPGFWMGFIDPERHSAMHMTFTNPATMAQFMKPETYSNMLDYGTWMSWMDIDNYKPMFQAQTWAYWMQPGAYAHMFDVNSYAQMIDPAAYEQVWNTALDTMGIRTN